MSFSNEIRALRKKCLLSQQDFAKELGISFTTVNRWETGKTIPNYKTLSLISSFCNSRGIDFSFAQELLEEDRK